MVFCEYHRDHQAIGICMRCRAVICRECCTRVDDVNHCHACLKTLAVRPAPRPPSSTSGAVLVVLASLAFFLWAMYVAQGSLNL